MFKIFLAFVFVMALSESAFCDLTRDLISAISRGKIKDVQKAVEKGAYINDHLYKDKTPLHWAVLRGNLKIVSYLLSKGADVNGRDKYNETPLEYSALAKDLDMVKLLVVKGADLNLHDSHGWTAMHYFTFYDNAIGVKYLIVQGAVITNRSSQLFMDIDAKSSPLDIALKKNYSNIIAVLQNPDKYVRLSNKPVLIVSCEKNLGPDNVLSAPLKGALLFSIENRGGGDSAGLTLVLDGVSNYDGLTIDKPPVIDLASGSKSDFTLNASVRRDVRNGTAVFKVFAAETNSFIRSDPVLIEIPVRPAIPPLFEISFQDNPGSIHAGTETPFSVSLKNSSKGYSVNTALKVKPVSGCEGLSFSPPDGISNISLGPDEAKNFDLKVQGGSDITDGRAVFMLIASDSDFQISATNILSSATVHMPRPLLQAFLVMDTALDTNCVVRVVNAGEAAARNIGLNLRISSDTNVIQIFHYNVAEIGTNAYMNLMLPEVLTNYFDFGKFTWNLSGEDSEKFSSISTNLEPGSSKN
ncbi:MAG: ankyrin repeat domain-containing protein [Brevinematales bacterium]|jgi:hypothetical protein